MNDILLLQHCRSRANIISQLMSQRLLQSRSQFTELRVSKSFLSDFIVMLEAGSSVSIRRLHMQDVDTCAGAEIMWVRLRGVEELCIRGGNCFEQLVQAVDLIGKGEEWALSALTHLELIDVQLGMKDELRGSKLLKRLKSLRKLQLMSTGLEPSHCDVLADCLRRLSQLESLSLSGNSLGDSGLVRLAEVFTGLYSLTELNLRACHMSKAGLTALLSHLPPTLHTLDLSSNALAGDALQGFSEFSSALSHLQIVNLSGNDAGPEGCYALIPFLKTVFALKELRLNCNYCGTNGFIYLLDALSMRHLASGDVGVQASLRVLEVSMNDIGSAALRKLAPHLQQLTELQQLDLSTNHFGPEGAVCISQSFLYLPNLRTLNLSENGIRDTGAQALSRSIKFLINLSHLYLSSNNIGSKGFTTLVQSLKVIPALTVLNFSHNPISDSGAAKAAASLVLLQELMVVDLQGTKVTRKGVETLVRSGSEAEVAWDGMAIVH